LFACVIPSPFVSPPSRFACLHKLRRPLRVIARPFTGNARSHDRRELYAAGVTSYSPSNFGRRKGQAKRDGGGKMEFTWCGGCVLLGWWVCFCSSASSPSCQGKIAWRRGL
jgi:hypothetical protein